MKTNTDRLDALLASSTATAWLVAGDEPLLTGEAADAIRARGRELGFTGREVFFVEPRFDWSTVLESSRALSLFAERRILEIRMPAARPGVDGGKVLAGLATEPPPDTLVLVVTGRLEGDAARSAWVRAFERNGVLVQAWPVEIGRLPRWIASRARARGLELDAAGARLMAERVEGNLLAAQQEIEQLALLHGPGAVGEEDVAAVVSDSARYDVFKLGEAALAGTAARALRILDGLRGEGTEATLVLWVLCREIRSLADARAGRKTAAGPGWQAERRAELVQEALGRMRGKPLGPLVAQAARADRAIKGRGPGKAWDELTALTAQLAGAWAPPHGTA